MFSCDEGLDLVGPHLSTCGGLDVPGEFTPSPPRCLGKWDRNTYTPNVSVK